MPFLERARMASRTSSCECRVVPSAFSFFVSAKANGAGPMLVRAASRRLISIASADSTKPRSKTRVRPAPFSRCVTRMREPPSVASSRTSNDVRSSVSVGAPACTSSTTRCRTLRSANTVGERVSWSSRAVTTVRSRPRRSRRSSRYRRRSPFLTHVLSDSPSRAPTCTCWIPSPTRKSFNSASSFR